MRMIANIFEQAAHYARFSAQTNILIIPVEQMEKAVKEMKNLPQFPVLYVTKIGYVPYATKMEIIRRRDPNLFLLGGKGEISEWVAYVLQTLTKGKMYRIIDNSK
jgi:hypothetical protein